MATWRCPHCGTPQAESARCWACSRSPLGCSTCRHFRRGVAGRLGYCANDRSREVLTGDELRACWQAPGLDPAPIGGLFGSLGPAVPWEPVAHVAVPMDAALPAAPVPLAAQRSTAGEPATPLPDVSRPHEGDWPPGPTGPTLFPATLAGRLRRHLPTRGPRASVPAVGHAPEPLGVAPSFRRPSPAPAPRPSPRPSQAPIPRASGRLVDAPRVPSSGSLGSLGDQLRRAEQLRRERALADGTLLDLEPLRRRDGGDPVP